MTTKHTPGPWYADKRGNIWRRPPHQLYENGGIVAGDKPLAIVERGWIGEELLGYPVEANARLIAAAPDLLEALQSFSGFIDDATIGDVWIEKKNAAIAKATQEK